MKSFFHFLTSISLRFRAVTLMLVVLVIVGGISAGLELQQELIPPVEFPQTFILAQASGMTSDEVLSVMTSRLEDEIAKVPEVVNIDSTTTGAFGAFVIASNDFGLDQQQLQQDIQAAIDRMWLPSRQIAPPDNQSVQDFVTDLMGDISPDMILYLVQDSPNLLFQLSPEAWDLLPAETTEVALAYLAGRVTEVGEGQSPLNRLIEQEVVPRLNAVDIVAQVQISGGQELPDEANGDFTQQTTEGEEKSLLLQLSPGVWSVVRDKIDYLPEMLDEAAVDALSDVMVALPDNAPVLPDSWQQMHFSDATDLLEMSSATRNLAAVVNDFIDTGVISGPPGQTDDLTPEMVTRMLEIEPSLVQYFEAEHLAAMSTDVFGVLPEDFISDLDGFTRDALAAKALAEAITGEAVQPDPVELPSQWRTSRPQLITFSFADLPLATFSVFTTTEISTEIPETDRSSTEGTTAETGENEAASGTDGTDSVTLSELPEGPELPQLFTLMGEFFGADLDTADDLVEITLPDDFAEMIGGEGRLRSADFFNLLAQFSNFAGAAVPAGDGGDDAAAAMPEINPADFLPALTECGIGLFDLDLSDPGSIDIGGIVIGCLSPDVVDYLIEYDPSFPDALQPEVVNLMDVEVLALDGISPYLDDAWNTLSDQPQFDAMTLETADDLLMAGDGSASEVLNTINASVPEQFAGYEVRLFDSLTPTLVSYFATQEADFYSNLDTGVLLKFSPDVLAALPDAIMEGLDEATVSTLEAIAAGDEPSAAEELSARYVTDAIPVNDDAPALNPEWAVIADFIPGVDRLENAFDLFRYPDAFETPAAFINSLFESAGGASFAPSLLGNLSTEAFDFIAAEDANFISELDPQALLLLPDEIFSELPENIRERAQEGERFQPTQQVTRTNGASSLLVTVFKDADANTVDAFYAVKAVVDEINAENDNIEVQVAFEQSSFIEESISGVIREGTLGALFAVINILIFLSGDVWGKNGRRIVGTLIVVFSGAVFAGVLLLEMSASGVGVVEAFHRADVLLRVLSMLGMFAGLLILFYPGRIAYPAWRSTLVIGVSIPLSILAALALMAWLPPVVNSALSPLAQGDGPLAGIIRFVLRLFPDNLTLNIMTLSGLTVAVGRVVDDSIVVLENIFRQLQTGMDKREAILYGVRDVSLAIFSATSIAVVVFLPLGLTGGLIGEFFLPFGLAVTYALASSFLVAVTVIPTLSYMVIDSHHVPEEEETWMQRTYVPILRGVLSRGFWRWGVIAFAIASLAFSGFLFGTRPAAFLPDFGEPQISISVSMPQGTSILETNALTREMETAIEEVVAANEVEEQLSTVRTILGGGSLSFESLLGGGGGISENLADISVGIETKDVLEQITPEIRERAEAIFGEENVTVSGGTLTSAGFGGFELIASGPDQAVLEELDQEIIDVLEGVEGITNVSSNLAEAAMSDDGPPTYIRVNGEPAISYTGELETDDTIGIAQRAIEAVEQEITLPDGVAIGQGFDTELQTEGFSGLIVAMGIALVTVIVILLVVFRSPVYWLALILSVMVAPVGAAIALTLTDRVLGISALIGLLMLIGLVVTNAIVLIDRVGSNRYERGMNLFDALIEAGGRRVRPILMTALATIIALIPLAVGLSEGAIIAAEMGTVVIGGVMSSTLLTLIVVPAAYYLLTPLHDGFMRLFGGGRSSETTSAGSKPRK